MKITVNSQKILRDWPRVEAYQNTTLRYTPPKNFPAYTASVIGKPKILRCWITLDEVWDSRTDEYFWDYRIGVNRFKDDPDHYFYDWLVSVPSDTKFTDYLTANAAQAEDVLLCFRRYEREVTDGLISYEKYQEVLEKVIGYYKKLCPNIKYIECCNESELSVFGGITIPEYYRLYKCASHAVKKLNSKHKYKNPLKLGGSAMSGLIGRWSLWQEFLEAVAADDPADRMVDFYSVHDYNRNIYRLMDFHIRHKELVKKLNIPDMPLFIDEYGTTGLWTKQFGEGADENLKNASGNLNGMILGSHLENTFIFPWCTFHDPERQINYTQFIKTEDGSYIPTPCGNAMTALHMMLENELEIVEHTEYKAVATGGSGKIALLVTNPGEAQLSLDVEIRGLSGYTANMAQYLVNGIHNNNLTGEPAKLFAPVKATKEKIMKGSLTFKADLEMHSFSLWIIG